MNYWMILKISLKALNRNKVRSALTMLGIIIGVSAVIAMVSLGEGARRQIQEEIASLGDSTVWVRAGSRRSWGVRSASGTMNTLKAADFEAMLNECPAVKAVSPSARSMAQVVFGNQNWNTRIEGYNELYPDMRNWVIAQGSFFDDSQVKAAARVAVLGNTVWQELFAGSDPVGQTIRVKNLSFQVIGTFKAKGYNSWGRDQDDVIIVPYTTVQKKFLGGALHVESGLVQAVNSRATYAAEEQIRALLRQRHRLGPFQDDDFMIRNLSEIGEAAEATNRMMGGLLAVIASVSLLVGGHRDHEHHVGGGLGAHPRDRHPHGHRGTTQPCPHPVPLGIDRPVSAGRDPGPAAGSGGFRRHPSMAGLAHRDLDQFGHHFDPFLGRHRNLLRLLSGPQGGCAGSHRSAPLRVVSAHRPGADGHTRPHLRISRTFSPPKFGGYSFLWGYRSSKKRWSVT